MNSQDDEIRLTLPNGYVIEQCRAKLLTKYIGAPNTLLFDLYAEEQLKVPGLRDRFTRWDALATTFMNSNIDLGTWFSLDLPIPEALRLPADHQLLKEEELHGVAMGLFDFVHDKVLRQKSEVFSQTYKLLAVKRPFFFPMIDNNVASLFGKKWEKIPWPRKHNDDAAAFFREFSYTLESCHEDLVRLQRWLTGWMKDNLEIGLELSQVRMLDSLIWFDSLFEEGKKQPWPEFGWRWARQGDGKVHVVTSEELALDEIPRRIRDKDNGGTDLRKVTDVIRTMVGQMIKAAV